MGTLSGQANAELGFSSPSCHSTGKIEYRKAKLVVTSMTLVVPRQYQYIAHLRYQRKGVGEVPLALCRYTIFPSSMPIVIELDS